MCELPVPRHLQLLAGAVKRKAYSAEVKLRCPCGCECFRIEKSAWTDEERRQTEAYGAAMRALTLHYHLRCTEERIWQRKRRFVGLRWVSFDMPQAPAFWDVQCIRVICEACREKYVVFDSRLHGYEAWAAGWPEETMAWQPNWRSAAQGAAAVTVCVEDKSFDVFLEENPELTPEDCSDLYENISIRYIADNGRSREVFSRETA